MEGEKGLYDEMESFYAEGEEAAYNTMVLHTVGF